MRGAELLNSTLGQELKRQAASRSHHVAIIHGDRQITYAELEVQSRDLAKGFLKLGLRRGDKVCLWLPNRAEWIITQFALARIGVTGVLANTRYRATEMVHILKNSDSRVVVFTDRFLNNDYIAMVYELLPEKRQHPSGTPVHNDRFPELRYLIVHSDKEYPGMYRWNDLFTLGVSIPDEELERAEAQVTPDDILYIIYTSGTTGEPKGSMTAHGPALKNAFNSGERQGFTADDRLLCFLPFFHCFGGVNGILNPVTHGATVVIQEQFDASETLGLIQRHAITTVYGVPTNFILLAETYRRSPADFDLSTWTKGIVGGGEVFRHIAHAIEHELKVPHLTNAYGMTESTAIITQTHWYEPLEERLLTQGKAMPDVEILLAHPGTIKPVGHGEVGEVLIRGFNVHRGYYKSPAGAGTGMEAEGWFRTGDLAMVDVNGNYRIMGRSKDMYKTSGFNVYPLEIENLLNTHPKVAESAVVGVPDPVKLEVGVAYVRLKPGESATEEEIIEFCKDRIANFKVPAYVRFVSDFPRSFATQKIQKHLLRKQALEEFNFLNSSG